MGPIIFNVTVKVDSDIQAEWLSWMKAEHIPGVMNTGLFSGNRLCRVLNDETDGVTFAVQYFCNNLEDFKKYELDFAPSLRKKHYDKYGERALAFRTLLEVI